jgi:hypothetical protein
MKEPRFRSTQPCALVVHCWKHWVVTPLSNAQSMVASMEFRSCCWSVEPRSTERTSAGPRFMPQRTLHRKAGFVEACDQVFNQIWLPPDR